MKNKFILIGIGFILTFALFGCGTSKNVSIETIAIEQETEPTVAVAIIPETTIVEETTTAVKETEPETTTIAETEPPTTEEETTINIEEVAAAVVNGDYGNGPAREEALGDNYEEIQNYIDANYEPPTEEVIYYEESYEDNYSYDYSYPSGYGVLTPDAGINYYDGVLETYYNLDMSWNIDVMRGMGFDEANYPYWIRSDGCKMLGDYVMVAADFGWEPRGTITYCSLGPAIVVDTGGGGWYWHDICVTW